MGKVCNQRRHLGSRLVVAAESVWKTCIRITADVAVGDAGEFLDVGAHLGGTEGAVDADGQWLGVADGVPEGLDRLAGEGAA